LNDFKDGNTDGQKEMTFLLRFNFMHFVQIIATLFVCFPVFKILRRSTER